MGRWLSACLLLAFVALGTDAKRSISEIEGGEIHFIDKFCGMESPTPSMLVEAKFSKHHPDSVFIVMDDPTEKKVWGALTCKQYTNQSYVKETFGIPESESYMVYSIEKDPNKTLKFKQASRPRYWYFFVANCDADGGVHLHYDLHMRNMNATALYREYSFDEFGLPILYIIFLALYLLMTGFHFIGSHQLYKQGSLHPIVQILSTVLVFQCISDMSYTVHFFMYSSDGIGVPFFNGLGLFADHAAQVTFILLLVLLMNGWAVTVNQIMNKKAVLGAVLLMACLYLLSFIWGYVNPETDRIYYEYEAAPGIILVVTRCIVLVYFVWTARFTYTHETSHVKRMFYQWFATLYLFWFLALPITVLIATLVDPWYRMIVVRCLYEICNFIGIGYLAFLLWPSRASEYFKIAPPDLLAGSTPYDTI